MQWWVLVIILAIVLIIVLAIRVWTLAVRIDRLHRRIAVSRTSLGRILVKRASDTLQLSSADYLDSESNKRLNEAARESLVSMSKIDRFDNLSSKSKVSDLKSSHPESQEQRFGVESVLSQALRDYIDEEARASLETDALGIALLEESDSTRYKLTVIRLMYNHDVSQVLALRKLGLSRFFHLAGNAALPEYVDFDDAI